jgi:hypothetical protein
MTATKVNTVLALTALWASRPGPDATTEQVAAWYAGKARVHEELAEQAPTEVERAQECAHAAAAAEHVHRLLLEAVPRPAGAEAEAVYQADRAAAVAAAARVLTGVSA